MLFSSSDEFLFMGGGEQEKGMSTGSISGCAYCMRKGGELLKRMLLAMKDDKTLQKPCGLHWDYANTSFRTVSSSLEAV